MRNGAAVRVRWLQKAGADLDKAMEHVARDAPDAAAEMYRHIRNRVDDLVKRPGLGRPGRVCGTRELVIEKYPYLVPYRVTDGEIVILRVFHTSRKPPRGW